jgi:hypothetical protein
MNLKQGVKAPLLEFLQSEIYYLEAKLEKLTRFLHGHTSSFSFRIRYLENGIVSFNHLRRFKFILDGLFNEFEDCQLTIQNIEYFIKELPLSS